MTQPFSLTPEQRAQFERDGVVRFEGLFSADGVRRARELVLRRLANAGITQEVGWRLDGARLETVRARYPGFDLSHPLTAAVTGGPLGRTAELEALGREPAFLAAADALLGGRPSERGAQQRLRVLLNLPDPAPWRMPSGWHTDSPRLASGESLGLQLFGFLDVVGPGGGGTLVAAGSHRLFNDARYATQPQVRDRIQAHPFFRRFEAEAPSDPDAQRRLMDETRQVGDVELKVLELTGEPGDAYFTDLRVAHCGRPDNADHPRIMITRPFIRADLVREARAGPKGL